MKRLRENTEPACVDKTPCTPAMARVNEPGLPESFDDLVSRLRLLHEERKTFPRPPRHLSLTAQERTHVLGKNLMPAVISAGARLQRTSLQPITCMPTQLAGEHKIANYLPAHRLCNGCRWFYSPEEFQWILRIGFGRGNKWKTGSQSALKWGQNFWRMKKPSENDGDANTNKVNDCRSL